MSRLPGILACACLAIPPLVQADIYMYVDPTGIAHFTNVPQDDRFRPIVKEPAQLATGGMTERQALEKYESVITSAAHEHRVEPDLVRAVVWVESGGDPRAVSKRGAMGLMQLMPATARQYGAVDVFDPEENVRAGTRFLRELGDRYGNNLELMLAAYNAGTARVEQHGRRIPPIQETLDYVPRVLSVYRRLRKAAAH